MEDSSMEIEFTCECVAVDGSDLPRAIYRVVDHNGRACFVRYCECCHELAKMDWNLETASIEVVA